MSDATEEHEIFANYFVIAVGITILIAAIFVAFVVFSPPIVNAKTAADCSLCLHQSGISPDLPVHTYYWLVSNEFTEPEVIIMKYQIGSTCAENCTLKDEYQSQKMIKSVQAAHQRIMASGGY